MPEAAAGQEPFARAAIIGIGLMGSSLALALKASGLVRHIVGYSPSRQTSGTALALGAIDEAAPDAASAVCGCDLVVLAVPVGAMAASFAAIAPVLAPRCLVIDVGSTKADVIAAARANLGGRLADFVPCHPIAGKEKAGAAAAHATLYRNRRAVITPLPENSPGAVTRASCLWQAVGSDVAYMPADLHDRVFAGVSHLPHLLAFAYINGLLDQSDGRAAMACGGPGFRDFSRVAGSEPTLWRDVLLANREAVLEQSRHFRQALQRLEDDLRAGDAARLEAEVARASQARGAWRLDAGAQMAATMTASDADLRPDSSTVDR